MTRGAELGDLPHEAVVGMAYIPMQRHGSKRFEVNEGLSRGTLYPGLELPWFNDFNVRMLPDSPMTQIQSLAFAIGELSMYLDVHKEDKEALELLRAYQKTFAVMREDFVKKYGPISQHDLTDAQRYNWVDSPWPWDAPEGRNA